MKKILTVDPGMNTAWAYWTRKTLPVVGEFNVNDKFQNTLELKFQHLWFEFDLVVANKKPDLVIIEGVEVYFNAISLIAARKTKFSEIPALFKLSYIIGGYLNICDNHNIHFEIVPFTRWGGQLTPEAVKAQVYQITKQHYDSEHIYDAVGIGLNYFGKL